MQPHRAVADEEQCTQTLGDINSISPKSEPCIFAAVSRCANQPLFSTLMIILGKKKVPEIFEEAVPVPVRLAIMSLELDATRIEPTGKDWRKLRVVCRDGSLFFTVWRNVR